MVKELPMVVLIASLFDHFDYPERWWQDCILPGHDLEEWLSLAQSDYDEVDRMYLDWSAA